MQFKELQHMTLEMMKAESIGYFKQYPKVISTPAEILIRIGLLSNEIKRKEQIILLENQKTQREKDLEARIAIAKEESDEMLGLQKELVNLNIQYIRKKLAMQNSGSGDIQSKNKKK